MFLLDTNTVIYYFKGLGRVAEHLLTTPPSEIGVSTVTVFELNVGIAKSSSPAKRRKQLGELLACIHAIPFGTAESHAAAAVRAKLEKAGTPIGPLDNLIAGTAQAHGAVLISRNVAELRRIRGLTVESWF